MPQPATAKAKTSAKLYHLPERLGKIPERLLERARHWYGLSSPCGKGIKFVMDLDHTLVHSALEQEMSNKDLSGMAALLDAEKSLLPEQRTLHCLNLAGTTMWVKLRPVARELLEKLAEVGQITIFTLGSG
ncbi:hypothetical protein ABBQ38_008130 [Trebouxia sp. C0009 RCD-2024]